MNLTKHIKEHIKSHALKDHPNECCGLIVEKNTKHEVFKCKNISASPLTSFSLDPLDYLKYSYRGKIKSVYHSHLEEEEFSEADKINSSYHNVNYIMFNIKNNSFREFNPKKQRTLYLNKPFKVGVNKIQKHNFHQKFVKLIFLEPEKKISRKPSTSLTKWRCLMSKKIS